MEDKKQIISKPDENGVRYYSLGPQNDAPLPMSADDIEINGSGDNESEGKTGFGDPGGPAMPPGGGRRQSMKKPLIVFGCILLAVVLLGVACSRIDTDENYYTDDHISILYIDGTISGDTEDSLTSTSSYDHQWTLEQLDDIINNPNNKGLILSVNTPGGGVYETDELYLKVQEYKATGRPVYSAMGSMAASGGYYLSAPADKIIANRNCWTGSIGVTIGTMFEVSELLDKYGVKTVTITAGKNKAMGSTVDPLTKEQEEILQALVDESYDQFVKIVADGRKMPVAKVEKLADGRIYTAKQAVSNGLVDQIGTLEEAIEDMEAQYNLEYCEVYDVKYEDASLFGSIFSKLGFAGGRDRGDVAALLEIMNDQGELPISYMSEMRK